jgi:hypothetical protein
MPALRRQRQRQEDFKLKAHLDQKPNSMPVELHKRICLKKSKD